MKHYDFSTERVRDVDVYECHGAYTGLSRLMERFDTPDPDIPHSFQEPPTRNRARERERWLPSPLHAPFPRKETSRSSAATAFDVFEIFSRFRKIGQRDWC